jgi:hypothetical protein
MSSALLKGPSTNDQPAMLSAAASNAKHTAAAPAAPAAPSSPVATCARSPGSSPTTRHHAPPSPVGGVNAALHHHHQQDYHYHGRHHPTPPRRDLVPTIIPVVPHSSMHIPPGTVSAPTISSSSAQQRTRSYSTGNVPPLTTHDHLVSPLHFSSAHSSARSVPHSPSNMPTAEQLSVPFLRHQHQQQEDDEEDGPPPEPSEACRAMEAAMDKE